MKILILGHARHAKDTVAEIIRKNYGLNFESSSRAAAEIFIFDALKDKYNYKDIDECFEDRVNHRKEWNNLICDYNTPNKSRLAEEIMSKNDIYVGMRDDEEFNKCQEICLFDTVIGVFDPRKELEPKTSFNIDMWKSSDIVIMNNSTLEVLEQRVKMVFDGIMDFDEFGFVDSANYRRFYK